MTATTTLTRPDRAAQLHRLPKRRLVEMYQQGIAAPGGGTVQFGGSAHPLSAWSKDDVVASILDIEYPEADR